MVASTDSFHTCRALDHPSNLDSSNIPVCIDMHFHMKVQYTMCTAEWIGITSIKSINSGLFHLHKLTLTTNTFCKKLLFFCKSANLFIFCLAIMHLYHTHCRTIFFIFKYSNCNYMYLYEISLVLINCFLCTKVYMYTYMYMYRYNVLIWNFLGFD